MSDRIKKIFQNKNKKLISFTTGGDPSLETSIKIIECIISNEIDIVEIGMPFSDPMADGPVIQKANDRAIKNKMNLAKTFKLVQKFRKKNLNTPIILMGYYNPIHRFGIKNFINKLKKNRISGVIVVDLPPEEDNELCLPIIKKKINFIKLATPTTDKNRFKKIIKNSSGFIYYVSITGITGANYKSNSKLTTEIKNLKKLTKLPIAVGFGIKNKKSVEKLSKNVDAVVVGSSIIKKIEEAKKKKYNKIKLIDYVLSYIKNLASAL